MKRTTVTSLPGFLRILEENRAYMWRGVGDLAHRLIPRVARDWHLGPEALKLIEAGLLEQFKIRAAPFVEARPSNNWEWLSLAQHHGLPTRLLDWTRNPLMALYFCCINETASDGAVYGCHCLSEVDTSASPNPFDLTEEKKWSPQHITPRLAAQDGLFTVSDDPTRPIEKGLAVRVRVKSSAKKKILDQLKAFGIHQASVFPGLDGVAAYVESVFFFFRGEKDLDAALTQLHAEMERRKDR